MKTLATLLLTFGIVVGSMASEKSLTEITSINNEGQRFTLRLAAAVGPLTVSIYDPEGTLIAKDHYRVDCPLTIPYNLSEVPEGNYKVHVTSSEESVRYAVASKKPTPKRPMAYARVLDEKTFSLKVLGVEKPGTRVTIYDQNHKRIATDTIDETGGFSKKYHMKFMKVEEIYLCVHDADGRATYLYLD
ncbi:hypothetical protein [Cyclobacterium xiamenense]|uniref:hypothetical protein n=1 Tax=Cyclobacterium xiamenense TaxID=1297121 RepID=UPI0035CF23B7